MTGPDRYRNRLDALRRYAVAVLAVSVATLLRWALPEALMGTPYLVFYPAVVAAAAFGGLGPGLLATVGSALCVDVLFTQPFWQLSPFLSEWARQAIFLAGGAGISIVAGLLRRTRARERQLNRDLEKRVAERTAEAEARAVQLRELAAELTHAEQRERQRVAYILHEHFQQLLVGAKFSLDTIDPAGKDPRSLEALRRVDQVLDEAIEESRSLAVELSPPILRYGGLTEAMDWLGHWMEDKHGLKVEVGTDPQVDPMDEGIRELLFHAARHLLVNVIMHARVDCARVDLTREADQLRLCVSDQGVGFDVGRSAGARRGAGFGLFSMRERLELLGGRLEVDSAPGKGTRVTLLVPVGLAAEPATRTAAQEAAVTERHAGPATQPKKIRVLLADDHTVVRDGLARLLQMYADIDVIGMAANGQQAIDLASQLQPDVVLMDVSMPLMDGIEATRLLRVRMKHVCVIGLSMHAEDEMAARMREAGANYYLTKTAPPDAVLRAIRGCMGTAETVKYL